MVYNNIRDVVRDLENNPVEKGGNIYHPIPFTEFSHLKTSSNKNEVYKKWHSIEKRIDKLCRNNFRQLKVLDIGANAGFYSFSLAQKGASVVAFEPHERYKDIGKVIIKEKKLNVKWIDSSFNMSLLGEQDFDVTLMLSVFQWMAEGGKKIKEAEGNLLNISKISKTLFFELGYNRGKSCIKTAKFNHYAELMNYLSHNTTYNYFALLSTTKLWKSTKRYLVVCSHNNDVDDNLFRKFFRRINI